MAYIIVGLGNAGEEYEQTRHNTGRIMLESFRKSHDLPEWEEKKIVQSLVSSGKVGKEKVELVMPETFMNKSGLAVKKFVAEKKAENLIVVYDDFDLPIGKIKVSYNRSSGGHRGLESIIKNIKTEAFTRVRVGIAPVTPSGKTKVLRGDDVVEKHILGKFKDKELMAIKKVSKNVSEALEMIISDGREKAMGEFNSK
ncbi:aminoacyl-tRNA hydrolase [Candidatus Parcubacteria bacterium]|nr:aminoacyl-tRNA hydrolase [Candidatus Parcubacteria bacterium]